MRATAPLLATLLITVAFAGCMGEDGDAATAGMATNETMEGGNLTNVSIDDGTKPMDVDVGHAPHIHDYWSGRDRVTLFDEDVTVEPFEALPFTFFNLFQQRPALGGTFFELPEGAIVYEGTGQLEFTATWSEATVTGMELQYQSAASGDFSEPTPLANDEAFVVDVTPQMTDMPHATTSRWVFLLRPAAGQSMVGAFHVKIDVLRMRDITLFPGHPQLFAGANTMTLFEGVGESSQSNFATQIAGFATGGGFEDDGIVAEKVVPMEAMTMTANLTITDVSTSTGEATEVWVYFKPADSRRYYRGNLVAGDFASGTLQFAWPVEMHMTDSPYATESQWRFDVRVGTQTTGVGPACDRCADVKVTYELAIVAYDSRLPDAGEDPTLQENGNGG